MTKFKRKLNLVWEHGTPMDANIGATVAESWRYVPRSLNGGPGWGVWDKKASRFLTDREVKSVPDEQLANERVLHS